MTISDLRRKYHQRISDEIIRIRISKTGEKYPNFADVSNPRSISISFSIMRQLRYTTNETELSEQSAGRLFEQATCDFLEQAFRSLSHLRPGHWLYKTTDTDISTFEQYEHLASVAAILKSNKDLASALGSDYVVKPDIIIARYSVSDKEINSREALVDDTVGIVSFTPLRECNRQQPSPILHASISCKWTIRSDRSQNTRTEALNLIRNRKGHLPHVVAVTAEPLPTRIATLALGTGDLDCVYHFALPELSQAVKETHNTEDQWDMLCTMIEGRRLRDISDLPFDLAV
ncbi:MAG: restriction endonuclease [Anaerolineae bacterium]|nr:restriction endonuclease [Anaerolineae bacterium]